MGNLDVTKKIVLTGGGTAGHVTPNIALIPHLREAGFEVSYIGSYDGMEKKADHRLRHPLLRDCNRKIQTVF